MLSKSLLSKLSLSNPLSNESNRDKLSLYWYSSEDELSYVKIYFSYLKDDTRHGYYIRESLNKEI